MSKTIKNNTEPQTTAETDNSAEEKPKRRYGFAKNGNYVITDNQQRGPWSKDEREFIAENYNKLPYDKIAKKLRRNPDSIKKYIKEHHGSAFLEVAKIAEYDIKKTPIWKDLERQFTKSELDMFLYHWGRIISQFRDDVYPTEEIQVVDTIKLEILMNRCLAQQQQCMVDIKQIDKILENEHHNSVPDSQRINSLEHQINVLRAAQDSLNSDFKSMLSEKNKILRDMKSTREARIKNLESNKHNFFGMLSRILNDKMVRYQLGMDMEKMRLAMEAEYGRLSEYHIYSDGTADQPLLTPENVLDN